MVEAGAIRMVIATADVDVRPPTAVPANKEIYNFLLLLTTYAAYTIPLLAKVIVLWPVFTTSHNRI